MSSEPVTKKKIPWVKLFIVGVAIGAIGLLLLRGVDVRGLVERGMAWVRGAGPVAFFSAMAVTPAVGVPATVFTLTAGPAFGASLGLGWVIALCLAAVLVNVALTHFLTKHALRPVLEKLLVRLGYKLPQVAPENMTDLAVILRVAPGSPFVVQNYLLGLAGVPLARNLLVVFVVQLFYMPAFVLFGDALQQGKGQLAMIAVGLLVAAVAVTHLLRKRYAAKKKGA